MSHADFDDDVICISDTDSEDEKNCSTTRGSTTLKTETANKIDVVETRKELKHKSTISLNVNSGTNGLLLTGNDSGEDKDENRQSSSSCILPNGSSSKQQVQEVIEIDDEIEELFQIGIPKRRHSGREEAESAMEDLIFKLRDRCFDISIKERHGIKTKLMEKFNKINLDSDSVAVEVTEHLRELIRKIPLKPKSVWIRVKDLISYLDAKKKASKAKPSSETPEERAERKKRERILQLEKHLKKLEKSIEKWDSEEVDLDDEYNSSYLVKTRMINEYMKHYKTLCRESGCTYYTGRPIEKKLKLTGITRFPEINKAVETFLNSKSVLYIPDFKNIYDIISSTNDSSRPPLLCKDGPEDEVHKTAVSVFERVMKILQSRRRQDFQIAIPLRGALDDPADDDEELRVKLEENRLNAKSEKAIFDEFAKKQEEEKVTATEVVDENPDDSAGETDDEDEDEDLTAEGVDNNEGGGNGHCDSNNDETAELENELEYTRNQVDDEEDENNEDVSDNVDNYDDIEEIQSAAAVTDASKTTPSKEGDDVENGVNRGKRRLSEEFTSASASAEEENVQKELLDNGKDPSEEDHPEPVSKKVRVKGKQDE